MINKQLLCSINVFAFACSLLFSADVYASTPPPPPLLPGIGTGSGTPQKTWRELQKEQEDAEKLAKERAEEQIRAAAEKILKEDFEQTQQTLDRAQAAILDPTNLEKGRLAVDLTGHSVMVVGDLHGDLLSLEVCLNKFQNFARAEITAGRSPVLLFLGDYVDRGPGSIPIIKTIAQLKAAFPNNVCLLRGNHEDTSDTHISDTYGFTNECKNVYREAGVDVQKRFYRFFEHLPVYAYGGDYRFMHGYIPTNQTVLTVGLDSEGHYIPPTGILTHEQISNKLKSLQLPYATMDISIGKDTATAIAQLVWDDPEPTEGTDFFESRIKGTSWRIPQRFTDTFTQGGKKIVRGHEEEPWDKYAIIKEHPEVYNVFSSYFIFALDSAGRRSCQIPFYNKSPLASVLKISELGDEAAVEVLSEADLRTASMSLFRHFHNEDIKATSTELRRLSETQWDEAKRELANMGLAKDVDAGKFEEAINNCTNGTSGEVHDWVADLTPILQPRV